MSPGHANAGRCVLITGAAGGIGLATARLMLEQGWRIVATDCALASLEASHAQLASDRCRHEPLDVTDSEQLDALACRLAQTGWAPDAVINNAGISPKIGARSTHILEMSLHEWQRVQDVNLTGTMQVSRRFLPGMLERGWGRIVNVSSAAGRTRALVAGCAYMAAKAGVLGLTRHLATVYARQGITANAVAPGRILTPMTEETAGSLAQQYIAANPSGREGSAQELAATIAFLASDGAGYINGACIDVNGGSFMN